MPRRRATLSVLGIAVALGSLPGCRGIPGAARPRSFTESAYTAGNTYRISHRSWFARFAEGWPVLDEVAAAVTDALEPAAMLIITSINDAGRSPHITILMKRNEQPHHIVLANCSASGYWMNGLRVLFLEEEDTEPIWQALQQINVGLLEAASVQPAEVEMPHCHGSIHVIWTPELNVRIDVDHDLGFAEVSPEAGRVDEMLGRIRTMLFDLSAPEQPVEDE